MLRRAAVTAILLTIALGTGGCVIFDSASNLSESLGSVSDSAGSFSDSSESSSGSSGDETAYRNDLRDYTVAHVQAGGSPEDLRLGLSEVALTRGITNWEAIPATFGAVGAGFAQAGLRLEETVAYRDALAKPGSDAAAAIDAGYRADATPSPH